LLLFFSQHFSLNFATDSENSQNWGQAEKDSGGRGGGFVQEGPAWSIEEADEGWASHRVSKMQKV